jgi:AraC-like DNA-binding protein
MLVNILPTVAHVRDEASQSVLRSSLHQMMAELRAPQPGSRIIVEHLATMLLAQALRAYALGAGSGLVGWLYALGDPQIGPAIGALHENPSNRWTVQMLADLAGMSRTSFAVRFKSRVGETPMQYLTNLRILLASERLLHSGDTVAMIAETLGYGSESAFSAAFKRQMGQSPRLFDSIGSSRLDGSSAL